MTTIQVLSVASPTSAFAKTTIETREVGEHDVRIEIAFSGICHSDLHQARNEWFEGIFPMVPGHEISGHVLEVGSKVTKHKVGDRVGVGTMVGSCGECEYCLAGRQNVCLKGNIQTYNGRFYDGKETYGATPARSWLQKTSCSAFLKHSTWPRRHRCSAPESPCFRR